MPSVAEHDPARKQTPDDDREPRPWFIVTDRLHAPGAPYTTNEVAIVSYIARRMSLNEDTGEHDCFLTYRHIAAAVKAHRATVGRALDKHINGPAPLIIRKQPGRTRGHEHDCYRFELVTSPAKLKAAADQPGGYAERAATIKAARVKAREARGVSQRATRNTNHRGGVAESDGGGSHRATRNSDPLNSERKSGRPARAREGSSVSIEGIQNQEEQNEERAVNGETPSPPDVDPVNEVVVDYGAFQRQHDLPPLNVRAGLRAQIAAADINPQDFRAVLERASRSDLLTGREPKSDWHGQGVSLVWLLNAPNRAKVLAGEYDRHDRPARPRLVSSRPQPPTADAPIDVWAELCDRMNVHVNRHTINTWLRPCRLLADQPTRVVVQAPNEETLTYVEARYRANLDAALKVIRPGATLVFHTAGEAYELNTATA